MRNEFRPRAILRILAVAFTLIVAGLTLNPGGFNGDGILNDTVAQHAGMQRAGANEPFDGPRLYREAFEVIRDYHIVLADPAKRAAWEAEWEHKFASSGDLKTEAGTDAAIEKMIESLGQRFDSFLGVDATAGSNNRVNSELVGIGINISIVDMEGIFNSLPKPVTREALNNATIIGKGHELKVEGTVEGGPAAGKLKAGDFITHVRQEGEAEAKALDGMKLDDATALIRGKAGSTVEITVVRTENGVTQTLTMQLKRAPVVIKVVRTKDLGDGVFYLRLDHFMSRHGLGEFQKALQEAAKGKALIIDLRGNPGGEVNQVMTMISHILPMGNVVTTINRHPGGDMGETQITLERDFMLQIVDGAPQPGRRPPLLIPAEMPVIVLIDEGSASASEMLSGSLQANHRAVIMGKPSHGKGVGQTVIPLSWGRQINVTSFEFRPADKAMDWVGVIPDIEVDLPEGAKSDLQLDAATAKAKEMIATAEARAKRAQELEKLHRENFDKELQNRNQKRSERLSQQP